MIKLARVPDGTSFFYAVDSGAGFHRLLSPIEDFFEAEMNSGSFSVGEKRDLPSQLLSPVQPTKIVCVGLNYLAHAQEQGKSLPPEPLIFMKPTSALIGQGQNVILPPQSNLVHHEAELAIIIGKKAKQIPTEKVNEFIFGYTCANDVSARDIQRKEKRYTRGKGFDTFCPLGPYVVRNPDFNPSENRIDLHLNGELKQSSSLDDFIFDIPTVVSFISHVMTLNVGDVILTGTPSGVGPISKGDEIRISISELCELKHYVTT